MKKIVIHSLSGGSGKTTITANLAVLFADEGYKVGVIDCNLNNPGLAYELHGFNKYLNRDPNKPKYTLSDFVRDMCKLQEIIYDVYDLMNVNSSGKLYLLPSSQDLDLMYDLAEHRNTDYILTNIGVALDGFQDAVKEKFKEDIEVLLIDTTPGLESLTALRSHVVINTGEGVNIYPMAIEESSIISTTTLLEYLQRHFSEPRIERRNYVLINRNQFENIQEIEKMIEEVYADYNCKVIGTLPYSENISEYKYDSWMDNPNGNTAFVKQYPEDPFTKELINIKNKLKTILEILN